MQEEFTAKLTGRFVDDDDIVRTGRAMLELDGFNMLHLPIPDGYKEQLDDLFGKAGVSAEAAKKSASAAGASAADAKKSETAAASSASSAKTSASGAASSASSASSSEKKAADSAKAATSAQESVTASASLAQESAAKAGVSEKAAASSASSASTDASKAAASEKNAAASASSAKTDADRVSKIAESTSWNEDKLTVNGKTSPSLTGPRGQQGEQGPKGGRGDTGPRGPKGDKGEPGGARGLAIQGSGADPVASGKQSLALGWEANAGGTYSAAVGAGANAGGDYSAAVGRVSQAGSIYSTAVGYGALAVGSASTAVGRSATVDAKHSNSTAIGNESATTAPYQTRIGNTDSAYHVSLAGDVRLTQEPTRDDNAATKKYVDSQVSGKADKGYVNAQVVASITPQKLGVVDFNTLQTSGVWIQNATADAQASTNNPINAAGLLEVSAAFGMVYQRFTYFWDTQVYVRRLYDDSWSPWKKLTME